MSDYIVSMPVFRDLSESESRAASNNGNGKEWANYIRVTHKGETLYLESDAMEPEDCRFTRDLGWIVGALRRAYELGRADSAPSPLELAARKVVERAAYERNAEPLPDKLDAAIDELAAVLDKP